VPTAYVVLLVSNLIFATGYSVARVVLEDIGPATLAMARLTIGSVILVPWAWRGLAAVALPTGLTLAALPWLPVLAPRGVQWFLQGFLPPAYGPAARETIGQRVAHDAAIGGHRQQEEQQRTDVGPRISDGAARGARLHLALEGCGIHSHRTHHSCRA